VIGRRYIVQSGDTLWSIAERHFGSGREWPRIWQYNILPDVARALRQGLTDPNHLHPGQTLLIPMLPATPRPPRARPPRAVAAARQRQIARTPVLQMCKLPEQSITQSRPDSHRERKTHAEPPQSPEGTLPFAIQYSLDEVDLPPVPLPYATLHISMAGDVALMSRTPDPTISVVNRRDLELKLTHAANQAFSRLVGEVKLDYDGERNRLSYSCMLVRSPALSSGPSAAVGVAITSTNPFPVIRYEFSYSSTEGDIDQFRYVAANVAVTIDAHIQPRAVDPSQNPERAWDLQLTPAVVVVAGIALVAGVLIAAFVSAAAAAASLAAATVALLLILRAIADEGADQTPRAALPAMVGLRVEISTRKG
jgi:hypothetical protein